MELEKKITEEENVAQEHVLDFKARTELDATGYCIRGINLKEQGYSSLRITDGERLIKIALGEKKVYYFSISDRKYSFNPKIFRGMEGAEVSAITPTKIELVKKGKKKVEEWHIGLNRPDRVNYYSYSSDYNSVRNRLLECARYRKKKI